MTVDELSAPLGQHPPKRRWRLPVSPSYLLAGALALFLCAFVAWAIMREDPFGGEPVAVASIDLRTAASTAKPERSGASESTAAAQRLAHDDGAPLSATPPAPAPPSQAPPTSTKTVTIIDGKTGARQELQIPDAVGAPARSPATADTGLDQKFVEVTSHGPIPKIAADGTRPAEAFARPVKPLAGKPDAPRIALIVAGLGISATITGDAITKLPAAVTLAFMPYGADIDRVAARGRGAGHEILLQVPMEPFGYPDNDPGPQTLLTSLAPEQNLDRLYWLMSRFQGYVGLSEAQGARFAASEQALGPVLREVARRGLIFVDDGSSPRSVAGRLAGASGVPFAKADVVLDAVPTPAEIERALARLEMAAREHGVAVGIASAVPAAIDRIARFAKAAESRGLLLVPISAVALKARQS
jgi:polysaccharide deacetylase 2 family uncharacterized protein YibQ